MPSRISEKYPTWMPNVFSVACSRRDSDIITTWTTEELPWSLLQTSVPRSLPRCLKYEFKIRLDKYIIKIDTFSFKTSLDICEFKIRQNLAEL